LEPRPAALKDRHPWHHGRLTGSIALFRETTITCGISRGMVDVEVNGKTSVLLEVGSGIHQELFHGGLIGSIVLSEEPMTICGTNGGMADAGAIGKISVLRRTVSVPHQPLFPGDTIASTALYEDLTTDCGINGGHKKEAGRKNPASIFSQNMRQKRNLIMFHNRIFIVVVVTYQM
jgi:hypothetical protein